MITMYDNDAQTRWNHGEFQVELRVPNNSRPLGYCDGSEEDEREVYAIAETEGAAVVIHKKRLKTGREIWTVQPQNPEP